MATAALPGVLAQRLRICQIWGAGPISLILPQDDMSGNTVVGHVLNFLLYVYEQVFASR